MRRRQLLSGLLGCGLTALVGCSRSRGENRRNKNQPGRTAKAETMSRLPSLFIGHGAPTIALDPVKGAPLARWGNALTKPRAIVVISAHWQSAPPTIGAVKTMPLIYDFSGFPQKLYEVNYAAPGAPDVADRVATLLGQPVARKPTRGLDHGVWTPLVHMFPKADVPVLQLSLPSRSGAKQIFELGGKLAPLRDEGVLIIGSGNMTHNLRAIGREDTPPDSWAAEFDLWARDVLGRRDWDELLSYTVKGPAFARNHPTEEHWLPLFVAAGAARDDSDVAFPVEGWEYKNLSRRAVQFG